MTQPRFAVCIPMANEEESFHSFIDCLDGVLEN